LSGVVRSLCGPSKGNRFAEGGGVIFQKEEEA
jgi:hypothetical protein